MMAENELAMVVLIVGIANAEQVRRAMDEVLDGIIQEHRDLASGKLPGGKPNDFVSCLLELPGEDGSPNIDEKSIKAIIIVSAIPRTRI